MNRRQKLFQIPVSQNVVKGGLHYAKSCGDIEITVENDEEITSIKYSGVEMLPLFNQIEQAMGNGLEYFYSALENFLQSESEMEAEKEENNAVENY
jgi:2',3'-cyclic-nucleotide 2'-phosphodiesterase (5'-nucleotidase family)